jgi:hypothetical protein
MRTNVTDTQLRDGYSVASSAYEVFVSLVKLSSLQGREPSVRTEARKCAVRFERGTIALYELIVQLANDAEIALPDPSPGFCARSGSKQGETEDPALLPDEKAGHSDNSPSHSPFTPPLAPPSKAYIDEKVLVLQAQLKVWGCEMQVPVCGRVVARCLGYLDYDALITDELDSPCFRESYSDEFARRQHGREMTEIAASMPGNVSNLEIEEFVVTWDLVRFSGMQPPPNGSRTETLPTVMAVSPTDWVGITGQRKYRSRYFLSRDQVKSLALMLRHMLGPYAPALTFEKSWNILAQCIGQPDANALQRKDQKTMYVLFDKRWGAVQMQEKQRVRELSVLLDNIKDPRLPGVVAILMAQLDLWNAFQSDAPRSVR